MSAMIKVANRRLTHLGRSSCGRPTIITAFSNKRNFHAISPLSQTNFDKLDKFDNSKSDISSFVFSLIQKHKSELTRLKHVPKNKVPSLDNQSRELTIKRYESMLLNSDINLLELVKDPHFFLLIFKNDPIANSEHHNQLIKKASELYLSGDAQNVDKDLIDRDWDFKAYTTLLEYCLQMLKNYNGMYSVDPRVQQLLDIYKDVNDHDVFTYKAVAEEVGVPEKAVRDWFDSFQTLEETISQIHGAPLSSISTLLKKHIPAILQELLKFEGPDKSSQHKNEGPKPDEQAKESSNNGNNDKNKKNNNKQTKEIFIDLSRPPFQYFQLGIFIGLALYLSYSLSKASNHEISLQEFTSKFLSKNLVSKLVVVNNHTAIVELNENGKSQFGENGYYYFTIGSIEAFERSLQHAQDEFKIDDALRLPVVYVTEGSNAKLLANFIPTVLFLVAIYYMTKKAGAGMNGPLNFGKSTAKKFNQETNVQIRFKDVAGMSEAKEEVMEFVKFLQNPEKYERLGAKIPRGAILSGPPGTGKTLIAKATAGEAGVPFYSVSGSEFVEMFVGVGASRVRDLFKTARENAPSIVFVDEIDAIGKQRSKGNSSGANDERETTLNQLLVEMDGFESSDHVVVLAGTNRADILDRALMRPGRFDRHIAIENPELQGRKEIFQVHLKKVKLVENIDADLPGRLAALTPGFSGADIANVCNEAALIGARFNAEAVTLRHFELAIERVIGGVEKKLKVLSVEEQKIVAYHEAGHAICGWYLRFAHPLLKVSIIPRGQGALGYAQYLPPDQYLMSALQLYDRMIMTLGGRVSEELHFSSVTSGAHDDFKKVTQIAQAMVLRFGMSKEVGMVNYADTRSSDDLTKPFSDQTNKVIDGEIQRIVNECYQKCKDLLTERAHEVELVAQELLKKEFITREDMIRLLGKRPFPETNDAFDKYLDGKPAFKNEQPENEKKDTETE